MLREWYQKHLCLNTDKYGTSFEWRKTESPERKGFTVWSTFSQDTKYFAPSTKKFMINLRVENLELLLGELKKEGITIVGEIQTYDCGKFAHIMDPEGTKIELWEPNDAEYDKMLGRIERSEMGTLLLCQHL